MKLELIFQKVDADKLLTPEEIVFLLSLTGPRLKALYQKADGLRQRFMGDEVYLRGIVEFSNYCQKNCNYCGIRKDNLEVERYRMSVDEIIDACRKIEKTGQTTVVLQSGEDPYYTKERMGNIISRIKKETSLAITLSVGERGEATYRFWKEKGMDRFLLRFETSNRELFKKCHPDDDFESRVNCIKTLSRLGVQTGSGFLIGLPGQTFIDLAQNVLFCTRLHLDMIGVGPFIPHGSTPFARDKNPIDGETYFKVISILRLLNKKAHIPSTTAFDVIDPEGRNLLLERGANVFMPNSTPEKYRKLYLLYPGKPCVDESSEDCSACVLKRIKSLGRTIGKGPGHSLVFQRKPHLLG